MKILVIEDSERLRRSLATGLSRSGFAVDTAGDGEAGLEFLASYEYDAVVLDLLLPKVPGLEVLRRLRADGSDVHVLILSAKDQVADRIRGLELGADDYLVKPFDFDELCARLKALIRRNYGAKNPRLRLDASVEIDTVAKQVWRDGDEVHLTPSEFAVLEHLALRRGMVTSKDQLVEHLYHSDEDIGSNVVEVIVSNLRKKIHGDGLPPIVQTRRGFGYVIE
jgi:DNA-binding response OmpR family regulator